MPIRSLMCAVFRARACLHICVAVLSLGVAAHAAAAGNVVISQVYGGGGNSGASLRNDFVELFNRSADPVDLGGWCLQYASSTGAFTLANNQNVPLSGTIQPGGYFLVQLGQGAGGTQALPTPDGSGLTAMSATAGKLALLNSCATAFGDAEPVVGGRVSDFVGYGTANRFEAAAAPALNNTSAAFRAAGGCVDSDNNAADFSTASASPRNSASPRGSCGPLNQPVVPICPATFAVAAGVGGTQTVSASDADGVVVNAAITGIPVVGITLTNFTPAIANGGSATATLQVSAALSAGTYPVQVAFTNADAVPQSAACSVNVSVGTPSSVRIRDIQGSAHLSPLRGQAVSGVPGIVTARTTNGFWFQDPSPDANLATSEAIFVFTGAAPGVNAGDSVLVSGSVSEFRPGGTGGLANLTTTEIVNPSVATISTGNALPPAVLIGAGGRVPPTKVIDDDASGDVETSGSFDAIQDGIDFYESLEGMRVQLNNAVAVGPTNGFGEIPVLVDAGAGATLRSSRGGIVIAADDFNPERVVLDDLLQPVPAVNVNDAAALVTGVLDYSFGNYKLLVTAVPVFLSGGLAPETTAPASPGQLTVASFNVENLDPTDAASKFQVLAAQIVSNLRAPDIVGLMEVQDNNGATNDAIVDASTTFSTLIAAIQAAGGPAYQFRQINPVDDQDGGEPGGNIRVGFLFNPARVTFVDRPGGGSSTATTVVPVAGGPALSASPGRIDPNNVAFASSRKPLAGEFMFNGRRLFVIANHFNSKGGDQPLFGHFQPPQRSSEAQREQQATIVRNFVQSILALDSHANVIVLGDLNDFEFSTTLNILKAASLIDLVETLPPEERYTYVFDGNSQVLDHILVSSALATQAAPQYDIVHVNSEFAAQVSDHEPEVVRLSLAGAAVDVSAQVSVSRSGLVFTRGSQTFNGTITVSNVGTASIGGPLQVRLDGLPSGVTLVNASGFNAGAPYLASPAGLGAGQSTTLSLRFSNPSRVPLNYSVRVFSGSF